jgi:dephospho-CoA kinase
MILGITGTNGAGKGTVVDYLVQKHGYTHYSVRAAITEEIQKRGLELNRTNLNEVATDLREKFGPGYFGNLFIEKAKKEGIGNYIIESIRNPFEAENIKEHGGKILIVDADRDIRFGRITSRASATDGVTFEEFVAQEDREMTSEDSSNPAKMSIHAVMQMADYTLFNNGSIEELFAQIDALPIFS